MKGVATPLHYACFMVSVWNVGCTTDGDCRPKAGTCDGVSPTMNRVVWTGDAACLSAAVALTGVCNTSLDKCTPSAGLGDDCAFGPDGSVFIGLMSDNEVLTAAGWRFVEPWESFGGNSPFPSEQVATATQYNLCAQAACLPACTPEVSTYPPRAFCSASDASTD